MQDRGNRGPGLIEWQRRTLPQPTDAKPGTEAKVQVLVRRARREELLWHPTDAKPSIPPFVDGEDEPTILWDDETKRLLRIAKERTERAQRRKDSR